MFKLPLGLAALAMTAAAMPTAAAAQRYDGYGQGYDRSYGNAYGDGYNRAPRYQNRDRGYRYRDDRRYQNRDDRSYRQCSDGTGGTIIGAIAGGLLGRAIDNRGDHATGTVLGGVGGALAGRAVERGGQNGCSRR